ncbi:hypothetical protein ACJ5XU_003331 [Providencia stuartii]
MKLLNKTIYTLIVAFISTAAMAEECIGDSTYQACTRSSTNAQGDNIIESYDTEGNSYSITSGSRDYAYGSSEVFSVDSEGNEYSIKSWCDSSGCHTSDSEGNTCTITNTGEMIGC